MITFFMEIVLGIIIFYVLLYTIEKRYSLRERFQSKYGRGRMKVPVLLFSFLLVVFVASFLQVVMMNTPWLMRMEVFVSGIRLGLLIYLLHIINPFLVDKKG